MLSVVIGVSDDCCPSWITSHSSIFLARFGVRVGIDCHAEDVVGPVALSARG